MNINKRVIIIFLCLIIVSSVTSKRVTAMYEFPFKEPDGYIYSDRLVPGTELSWKIEKLHLNEQKPPENILAPYKVGDLYLKQGDTLKLKIIEDPDVALNVTKPYSIFDTDEPWAEIYVNDYFITNDIRDLKYAIDFGTYSGCIAIIVGDYSDSEVYYWLLNALIYPATFIYSTSYQNAFDVIFGNWQQLNSKCITTTETSGPWFESYSIYYSISKSENVLTIKIEIEYSEGKVSDPQDRLEGYYFAELSYDTEWGILIYLNYKWYESYSETDTSSTEISYGYDPNKPEEVVIRSTTPGAAKPPAVDGSNAVPWNIVGIISGLMAILIVNTSLKLKKRKK